MTEQCPSYERFEKLVSDAPNHLTLMIRSHHAIENEVHGALEQLLSHSKRLDLRKIPFLTKIDLLISLRVLPSHSYPFLAEVNRLRNRFAHDPNASFTEEDGQKLKNVYTSIEKELIPADWVWTSVVRNVCLLLQSAFLFVRSAYELTVRQSARSFAISQMLRTEFPEVAEKRLKPVKGSLTEKREAFARAYLRDHHPDVSYED